MVDTKKIIKRLEDRKAQLWFELCEDDRIYIPEVIAQMVFEIRQITKMLNLLNEGEKQEK